MLYLDIDDDHNDTVDHIEDDLVKRKREEHAKEPKRFNSALKQNRGKDQIRSTLDAQ